MPLSAETEDMMQNGTIAINALGVLQCQCCYTWISRFVTAHNHSHFTFLSICSYSRGQRCHFGSNHHFCVWLFRREQASPHDFKDMWPPTGIAAPNLTGNFSIRLCFRRRFEKGIFAFRHATGPCRPSCSAPHTRWQGRGYIRLGDSSKKIIKRGIYWVINSLIN